VNKRVVITGASGFIGSAVHTKLKGENCEITILSHSASSPNGELECDLLDKESVSKTLPECDVIIHLASRVQVGSSIEFPAPHLSENPQMLLNILDTLRERNQKPLIVFASTDRQYGKCNAVASEETTTFPIEPYSGSKMICEILLRCYQHTSDIPFISLRIDSVYGPGQPEGMLISDVIKKMLAGDTVSVGSLDTEKCFVFVDDVASAFVCALKAPTTAWNSVYNIGDTKRSLQEILSELSHIIEKRNGHSITIESDPSKTRDTTFEVGSFALDCSKAKNNLGWKPLTSLGKGLTQTVESFA